MRFSRTDPLMYGPAQMLLGLASGEFIFVYAIPPIRTFYSFENMFTCSYRPPIRLGTGKSFPPPLNSHWS